MSLDIDLGATWVAEGGPDGGWGNGMRGGGSCSLKPETQDLHDQTQIRKADYVCVHFFLQGRAQLTWV